MNDPKFTLSSDQALEKMSTGAVLLDVRTKQEFDEGHLEGARLIPHDALGSRLSEVEELKDKTILLYCKSGGRSQFATELLRQQGFTGAFNIGGYENLKALLQKML